MEDKEAAKYPYLVDVGTPDFSVATMVLATSEQTAKRQVAEHIRTTLGTTGVVVNVDLNKVKARPVGVLNE